VIIHEHLCGVAIAFQEKGGTKEKNGTEGTNVPPFGLTLPPNGDCREQGSLYNFQKRQVRNAVAWLSEFSQHSSKKFGRGPLVFVCTTSPNWGPGIFTPKISSFTHTLRNGYGCENYAWVREFTEEGYPHYHFIADLPDVKRPTGLSRYWSGLFGACALNSVRLGSKPDKNGKRTFRVSPALADRIGRYLAKYLSKQLGTNGPEHQAATGLYRSMIQSETATIKGRKFGISQEVGLQSKPEIYRAEFYFEEREDLVLSANGQMVKAPAQCIGISRVNRVGEEFDKTKYEWRKAKDWPVWFGNLPRAHWSTKG